jgi:hypothetical protein
MDNQTKLKIAELSNIISQTSSNVILNITQLKTKGVLKSEKDIINISIINDLREINEHSLKIQELITY